MLKVSLAYTRLRRRLTAKKHLGCFVLFPGFSSHRTRECIKNKATSQSQTPQSWAMGVLTSMQQACSGTKLDRFSNTATALANLCISVHYGKLNLTLPSASKMQKITFILMKCTKTVATRTVPFGLDMHQIVCRLGLRPRPTGELIALPQTPLLV